MEQQLTPATNAIARAKDKFTAIAQKTGMDYDSESMYAWQVIRKNDYLMKIANQDPDSLRDAVINVASIGLSLNPATQYAYLVPRNGSAMLDISYKGLIKIATDTGSIMWAQAELVYENDKFTYHGPADKPSHECDPFSERGEFRGVYCIAKTHQGDILTEVMSAADLYTVRDKSESFKRSKKGPWVDFFGEMAKKTIIKRASKTWPRTDQNRLQEAIEILNQHEGIEFEPTVIKEVASSDTREQFQKIIDNGDGLGLLLMRQEITTGEYIELYNSGEKGQKTKLKSLVTAMEQQGVEELSAVVNAIHSGDNFELMELTEDTAYLHLLPSMLSPEDQASYSEMIKEAS